MKTALKYRVRRFIFYFIVVLIATLVLGEFIGQAIDRDYNYNINLINEFNEMILK